jgi:predicted  nucleic acid-binding Zn-ribbon protein
MSETKSSLIDQFSQAIQSVKNRITGYNGQVKQYKQGVNANADRLRELVDRLRKCLEGLNKLKQNHEGFVTKLQSIYQNINTERDRAVEDSSTEEANKCNDKIKTIYDQFKELESTLSEMDTDFSNTIGDQVEALNGVIDELCKEGDGLSNQITSSSKTVGEEIDKLSQKFSSSEGNTPPDTEGRSVYINSQVSNIWKSAGEPPDTYYFRTDGQSFNDGTGPVESSYTHPKDYPMQGGWLSPQKLNSLSKTQPIRSLKTNFLRKSSQKKKRNKTNKTKRKKKNKTKRKKKNKTKRKKTKKNKK